MMRDTIPEAMPGTNPPGIKSPTLEKLLDDLKIFITDTLKNYRLFVEQEEPENQQITREAEVSIMVTPEPDENHKRIPYVLLQLINGSDIKHNGQMQSRAEVRIVIVIYNQDRFEGRMQILRIIQKIRYEILRAGIIGKMFTIDKLEYLIYPDETEWYHMGELSTQWIIPPVERDLSSVLKQQ